MKQALYRKYRPKNFDEIFGQDSITTILKNQIKNDKISHAYVFSGTRGTGKTSTAKIFAKAVNCLNPIDGNPCNECANCKSILTEENMDVIEMDAASNRRIDDIRQLRDQVIYPPTSLKYKVYIIDEAHMITNDAFNALLKIMEEPPKHLIFILATTEIDKIPDTILSRTQRYEFKSLSENDIIKQIEYILKSENIKMEERAIEIIASVASGAMRDALSVLDQVISIGDTNISTNQVTDLLGIFSDDVKVKYAKSIFDKNIKNLLNIIDEELQKGKDAHNFIKEIITFFKDLLYIKVGIKDDIYSGLTEKISLEQIINSIDILLEYEEIMKKSDSTNLLFRVGSARLIDYLPRKQLEAKIKNLEERLDFIEKNGYKNFEDREDNGTIISNNSENKINISVESREDFLTEDIYQKEPENSVSDNLDVVGMFRNIIDEKYPTANLIFEGLKKTEHRMDKLVFYIDKEHMPMRLSMNFFFKKACEDLYEKINKKYEVEFLEFRNQDLSNNDEKINRLKGLFSEGELIIKDKK
ncbi:MULTISPECIES: DNA polymerase III subunit gamma/tau [Helcococcus]|uniref:DNA-directed DNA polymerase n=1 Tax=Helcococcus bovis TaxID=3153252 RepID=A0ABW9F843_9FIRM